MWNTLHLGYQNEFQSSNVHFHTALNYIDPHLQFSFMASPFPRYMFHKKWGDLVNETVKGSFFIIEQTEIMIGLLF